MTIRISVDNLTVVGRVYGDVSGFLEREVALEKMSFGKYPYRGKYHFMDGSVLEVAEIDAVRSGKVKDLRYEFNPNKGTKSKDVEQLQARVLSLMYDAHITRVDVAIDTNIDMSKWKWVDQKGRPSNVWYAGTGEVETWYIGGKSSPLKIRIYDKAKEQGERYRDKETPWWRVEVQMRGEIARTWYKHGLNPFQGVTAVQGCSFPELPIKDRAMLEYLMEHPEGFAELSRPTKYKYKEMLRGLANWKCEDFQKIWEQKETDARQSVRDWLNICDKEKITI